MTIAKELHIIELTTQQNLRVPAPPECDALLAQGRKAGIAVSQLYVLRAPLWPRKMGAFVRDETSIWIFFDPAHPEDLEQALRSELYALAHAEVPQRASATIDDDWNEVRRLWERAVELAQWWGWEHLFPAGALQRRLEEVETLREHHWQAGYLAGSLVPVTARAAYDALCDIRQKEGWAAAAFGDVLAGLSEDSSHNGVVLDFDRCQLSGRSWRQPYRPGHFFGPLELPHSPRSDRLLRSALAFCAEHPAALDQLNWRCTSQGETKLCFLQIEDEQDLFSGLRVLNALLLENGKASVLAMWHCYGDPSRAAAPPIYRLALTYSGGSGQPDRTAEELTREIWILFPSRHARHAYYEAALQRYIASWRWASCEFEGTRDGLAMIWGWLK